MQTRGRVMSSFSLTIIASEIDPNEENLEDRFCEAGCDDATISFQKGALILEFTRDAKNFMQALVSAYRDVLSTGAKVTRIEPDHLVTLTDIANRSGLSRAAVSLYAKGARGTGFPAPIARVTTESPLWDWVAVAHWMYRRGQFSRDIVVQAKIVRGANFSIRHTEGFEHSAFSRRLAEIEQEAEKEEA